MTEADRRRLAELCGIKMVESKNYEGNYYWERWWHPDESIEQAMMVAEAMRESLGWWISLQFPLELCRKIKNTIEIITKF